MEKLKPCPFCGGAEISVWDKSRYDVCVRCDSCNSQTGWHSTIDDAITAWNTRQDSWVPVEERLPQVDKYGDIKVLVHMYDGFIITARYYENNGWELWRDAGEVTHWMPLPEPPKTEGEE